MRTRGYRIFPWTTVGIWRGNFVPSSVFATLIFHSYHIHKLFMQYALLIFFIFFTFRFLPAYSKRELPYLNACDKRTAPPPPPSSSFVVSCRENNINKKSITITRGCPAVCSSSPRPEFDDIVSYCTFIYIYIFRHTRCWAVYYCFRCAVHNLLFLCVDLQLAILIGAYNVLQ